MFPYMFMAKEMFSVPLIQCRSSCWCVGINSTTCGMDPVIPFFRSTTDPVVVYRVCLICLCGEVYKADLTLVGSGFDRRGRIIGLVERERVSKGFLRSGVWRGVCVLLPALGHVVCIERKSWGRITQCLSLGPCGDDPNHSVRPCQNLQNMDTSAHGM